MASSFRAAAHKSVQVGAGCRELCGPLCLTHLRPPRCELCDHGRVHEEKERKAGSSLLSVKCPFVIPGTWVPGGHNQDRLCCSLLPLCGQQVSWLTWTLWFCQQGEKGFPGETGLPGNVGYPGKEGDQGKLGEKVTDISSFFFLLSYRVPAQSSLHLFLLYYILLQSFFLNGNPVIKHPSL